MRYAILLTTLSLLTGCKKPDAWLCTFVYKGANSYSFCKNLDTKEEKIVSLPDMKNWITTDPDSYKELRDYYKASCK